MIDLDRLFDRPDAFRRLTGLSVAEFRDLAERVRAAAGAARDGLASQPGRRRKPGAGRKYVLTLEDRVLMLLVYFRVDIPMKRLGALFGVDAATVCRNIRTLEPLFDGLFRIAELDPPLTESELVSLLSP